jgi:hypothetical protein
MSSEDGNRGGEPAASATERSKLNPCFAGGAPVRRAARKSAMTHSPREAEETGDMNFA